MAGTSWPSLNDGQTARPSEVESKFDWLEGSLVPMSAGSTTDAVHDLGTTTAYWRTIYTRSLAGTSTALCIAVGTTAVATTTFNSDASVEFSGARTIVLPRLTTVQRDALTGFNGMSLYNSTANQFQFRENGAWVSMGGSPIGLITKVRVFHAGLATATILEVAASGRLLAAGVTSSPALDTTSTEFVLDSATSGEVPYTNSVTGWLTVDYGNTSGSFSLTTTGSNIGAFFKEQLQIYSRKNNVGPNTSTIHVIYERT